MQRYAKEVEDLSLSQYKKMMQEQNKKLRIPALAMVLPVFPEHATRGMMATRLKAENEHEFIEYDLDRNWSGIQWHYEQHQRYHLILPILGLIQLSPLALHEFLFGGWELGGEDRFDDSGLSCMEEVLSRLLYKALGDLVLGRDIPERCIVYDYFIRPREYPGTVLSMILKDHATDILFDAGWEESAPWVDIRAVRVDASR